MKKMMNILKRMRNSELFILSENIILRKEYFGGILFNRDNAATIEFDDEIFHILYLLKRPLNIFQLQKLMRKFFGKDFSIKKIQNSTKKLVHYGFIKAYEHRGWKGKIINNSVKGFLCAPETVHLSVTNKCNLNCQFCYENKEGKDMSTEQILSLIDELTEIGVFQLAIGGGEPLIRKDIFEIINYCKRKGIVPNLTTNGLLLTEKIIKKLKGKIGQLNISSNENLKNVDKQAIQLLNKNHIKVGINLLVTHKNISDVKKKVKEFARLLIENIVVLRPKPVPNRKWYNKNKLRKKDIKILKPILDKYERKIRVDCSLVFLMSNISPIILQMNGIYGCVGGTRFCTIKNNGDVFPCSFFNSRNYLAGNVLNAKFIDIWKNSKVFKRFRKVNNRLEGWCSACINRNYCKGCRRIALEETGNLYSAEYLCG